MPSIYINENDVSGSDQLFISNIYSGKILGEIMRLQDKTININTNGETTVTYDSEYTGLNSVKIITNVPNPSTGSLSITSNGTYDVTEKASAIVNVQIGGDYTNVFSLLTNNVVPTTETTEAEMINYIGKLVGVNE